MFKYLALALVIATTEAAFTSQEDGQSCHDVAVMIGEKCDKNGNEKISWKEAKACGIPKEFKKEFMRVAGKDKEVSYDEFMAECRMQ